MSTNKITLYVKQHTKTGKKYFGMSRKYTPKYLGSGVYWLKHIKKHGIKHVIELHVWEFDDQLKCTEFALEFSKENNIVESKEWANLREENGLDGNISGELLSSQTKELWAQDYYREAHLNSLRTYSFRLLKSEQTKELWKNKDYVEIQSVAHKEAVNTDEYRKWHSDNKKKLWQDANYREKTLKARENCYDEKYRLGASNRSKERWSDPEYKLKLKQSHSGKLWWNNNKEETKSHESPGFEWTRGRLKRTKII